MGSLRDLIEELIGGSGQSANPAQIGLRAAIIYLGALVIVRAGKKRFMGQNSAFDVVLLFILGSVLSRGVNGQGSIIGCLTAGFVLVGLHWLFSFLGYRYHGFGDLVKGHDETLVTNGHVEREQAKAAHISDHDLMEGLRQEGVDDLSRVKTASLERSGKISVIRKD